MRAYLFAATLLGLASCSDKGTFVVLHFENGPQDVNVINATLTLGADTKVVPYNAGAGAMFQFPRTAVIEIGSASGTITVAAQAIDSTNMVLATATGMGTVTRDSTVDVHLDFTSTMMQPADMAMPGTLVILPTAFDFGAANVGQMGIVKRFTVTNTGTVASGAIAVSKTGDMNDFTVASPPDCMGKSLDANQTCTVDVQLTPLTALLKNAQLVVTANGPGGATSATLLGKGVAKGDLSFNEDAHTFPDTVLGTASPDITFTLTNGGLVATAMVSVTLAGTDKDQFEIVTDGCSNKLLMGKATCDVIAHAKPSARGTANATLEADAGNDTAIVTLTGKGLGPAHITITNAATMASPFDLGQVDVGATGDGTGLSHLYTFMIVNDGDLPTGTLFVDLIPAMNAEITALMPQTTCMADNSGGGGGGGQMMVLNPGDSCTAVLALEPATFGLKNIALTASATPGGMATTYMKGVGHDQVTVKLHNDITTGGTGSIQDGANLLNCDLHDTGQCMKTFDRTSDAAGQIPKVNLTITNLSPNASLAKWTTTGPVTTPCDSQSFTPCSVLFDSTFPAGAYVFNATYTKSVYTVNVNRYDGNYGTGTGSLGSLTFMTSPGGNTFSTCGSGCSTNSLVNPNATLTITASGLAAALPAGDFPLRGILVFNATTGTVLPCQEGGPPRTITNSNAALVCTVNVAADLNVQVLYSAHNYAFVTSQTFDGALGGLGGADAKCQAAADARSIPGSFKAILSDSTTDAAARLPPSRDGWVRFDGRPFASSHDELFGIVSGTTKFRQYLPILFDEKGVTHGNLTDHYRTNSTASGIRTGSYCSDWTFNAGANTTTFAVASGVSGSWIDYNTLGTTCADPYGLICMGTNNNEPIPPPPSPPSGSRYIFLSSMAAPSGGLVSRAAMDAECMSEGAGLGSGKFRAFVSTQASTAQSQAMLTSLWVRPDNFPVGDQTTLLTGGQLQGGIIQYANGTYVSPSINVFTGATAPNVVAANGNDDCGDWGNTGLTGRSSRIGLTSSWFNASGNQSCAAPQAFYCIEYGP